MNYINDCLQNTPIVLYKQADLELDCFGYIPNLSRGYPTLSVVKTLLKGLMLDLSYRIQNFAKLLFLLPLTATFYVTSQEKFQRCCKLIKITSYGTLDPILVKRIGLTAEEYGRLGQFYENRSDSIKDRSRALEYYELGVQKKDGFSLYRYATILREQGEHKESKKILELLNEAKKMGIKPAAHELMETLHEIAGQGEALMRVRRTEEALKSFKLAASFNHPDSHYQIGMYYYTNWCFTNSDTDLSQAIEWFKSSIELESYEGTMQYVSMLRYGIGMEIDLNEALRYCKIAQRDLAKYNGYADALNYSIRVLEKTLHKDQAIIQS